MTSIDSVLNKIVDDNAVPFVVAMAGNSKGTIYSGASGSTNDGVDASEDTLFRMFSMSKGIGSLAALILLEREAFSIETPVADIVPEWKDIEVLDGWDGDEPILREPKTTATVRHLMTHTSGLEYELWNAEISKYLEKTGHPSFLFGSRQSLMYPLTSDPGTRWGYGLSTDWLTRVVEEASGQSIDAFCKNEIFDPLGMQNTVFEPEDSSKQLAELKLRGVDGQFVPFELAPPSRPEVYGMGHALYSTGPDFMQFTRMVLNGGELDGARIISSETAALMEQDMMQGLKFTPAASAAPAISADLDPLPGMTCTHSLAFLRNEDHTDGLRSTGSLTWAGGCNTHFWIDPAKDVCGLFLTQCLPFLDPQLVGAYQAFERATYMALSSGEIG